MKNTNQDNEHIDDNTILFINDDELNRLCLEIDKYSDDIATIFSKIDSEIDSLNDYYKSDSTNEIISYYNELRKNYGTIKYNINSYADDLIALSTKIKSGIKDISLQTKSDTEDIETKVKTIKNKEDFYERI